MFWLCLLNEPPEPFLLHESRLLRMSSGPYLAGGQGGQLPPPGKLFFFSNIVFDFAGLFFVDILVRNLSLPPQTKNARYGPGVQSGLGGRR